MKAAVSFHTDHPRLDGRSVLVSGGTTGIGRAIAGLLASHGAKVFVFGRHHAELEDALRDIRSTGEADGMTGDVARADDIADIFKAARDFLGPLDIFVDNAGLSGEGIAEMPDSEWRYVVETNLIGAMATAEQAADWMKEAGSGHIVIIGSMSAERKGKSSSVYVATKSGLRGFAESFYREVREDGIKVTLIEPGRTGSDMIEDPPNVQRKKIARGEMLRAEDVAVAVHYAVTQPARCDVTFMQVRPHIEPDK
jgi:NAD(P)-dependent dehydrogenase (short-subunit alcohol dehydrogenase family)